MSPEPIYLRFENTSPPHRKFYEVEVELSLFYPKRLVRRWGRIGCRRPRSIRMVMADPGELARQVEVIARLRQRHGYQTVADVRAPVLHASAA
jgi:predicted DNA-binding WGR domain protein